MGILGKFGSTKTGVKNEAVWSGQFIIVLIVFDDFYNML